MRRVLFGILGVLELLAAIVFLAFAWQLPDREAVRDVVGRVESVGRETTEQVRGLQQHFDEWRDREPRLAEFANQLRARLRTVADSLKGQQFDARRLQNMRDAMGNAARGLADLGETLDPQKVGRLGDALKATADFLELKLAPAAENAARNLARSTGAMKDDAQNLAKLLREAPVDLKAARAVAEGLAGLGSGLETTDALLNPRRIKAIQEGFAGVEQTLTAGADEVERLGKQTIPDISWEGFRPVVNSRPILTHSEKMAAGMRMAAKGASAAAEQVADLSRDLPALRKSLRETLQVIAQTREGIDNTLKQHERLDALLKSVPEATARLAEGLPKLGEDLSKVLRETGQLKEVAGFLRQAHKGLDGISERWPELRKGLADSAKLLRDARAQLDFALEHRDEFAAGVEQTAALARSFSESLPELTDHLQTELGKQSESLGRLGSSIEEVTAILPGFGESAGTMLFTARLLLAVVGCIFAVHGIFLLVPVFRRGDG